MGIYDVAEGDLFSEQQRQYSRTSRGLNAVTRAKDRRLSQPRATGPTGKTSLKMTEAEKQTVCLMVGQGSTPAEIALKLGRALGTIQRTIAFAEAEAKKVGIDWKSVMKDKAVVAVNDALDAKEDLYKRGTLGMQALKGLGELENDGGAGNLTAIFNSVPPDMRDRYLTTDDIIANSKNVTPETPTPAKEP